jgi:HSP20 family molecular chaperone IbpA
MSFFAPFAQELTPLFRVLEDFDRASRTSGVRFFQPKFDLKELKDAYELHGELPGIEQKDVSIEWTDGNTLTISGKTEKTVERGTRPAAAGAIEDAPTASGAIQAAPEAAESGTSNNEHYRQPSVADEGADEASTVNDDNNTALTPATTNAGEVAKTAETQQQPEAKYWVSERSIGEFHRSFRFPTRVDHEAVKASLKNGILSILVPKAQAPRPRKIEIQ